MNILRILAWKNLKRNKKRTIATIIGIVVSVALISFILTLIYSFKYSMLETTKRNVGNYHIHIDQTTTQKAIEFAKMTDKIERIGISQTIGAANYESQLNTKNGIIIDGYDEVSLTNRDINLIEGRLPQNEKEILVSNYLINNLDEPIKIGDQLTLDVEKVKLIISNDGMQESLEPDGIERVTYTVTGIIQQTRKEANTSNAYIATTKLEQMTEVRPCEVTMLLKNPKEENLFYQELNNSSMQNHLSENNELLIWQGATKGMNEKSQLELIGVIAIIIVVAITIVLVRNSFQISISERMKEFGTLISIGATSKQIRKIVLIEGLIYAIISIPIGLIFGIGVVYFSINGIEKVLASTFGNSWIMEFSINIPFIFVTILITILAILFSCIKPIRKAKKASPIETIKQKNLSLKCYISGYSLAGLFSLYAMHELDLDGAISVSGSLWKEGWLDYLKEHPIYHKKIYLSLGSKEHKTRNVLMKNVLKNTLETYEIYQKENQCFFEKNVGNHFFKVNKG